MSYTYKHPSLFNKAEPPRQLQLLADAVLEMGPSGYQGERDRFDERLQTYAKTAGISLDQARRNVCIAAHTQFNRTLQFFGVDVV